MALRTIPLYVICGNDAAEREAFFRDFCKTSKPLRVFFDGDVLAPAIGNGLRVSAQTPARDAGETLAEALSQGSYDSVWADWPDTLPVEKVLAISNVAALRARCKLRKIIRCGDGEVAVAALGAGVPLLGEQLAQCDLFAVRQRDRREIARICRRFTPYQPDIEVIAWEDRREISTVLAGRSVLQGVRFVFVLVAVGALLAALARLNFSVPDSIAVFLGTYLQALPFLILGILLSSAIQVFVPAGFLQQVFPKNLPGGMLFGVLGGFLLPICDCASIPVFRSLLRKGVPLPAAVTFMIAAPIINPVVLLSTYYAFGANPRVMLARMGFGIVCAVLVGLCFTREKRTVLLAGGPVIACVCGHDHGDEGNGHDKRDKHAEHGACACQHGEHGHGGEYNHDDEHDHDGEHAEHSACACQHGEHEYNGEPAAAEGETCACGHHHGGNAHEVGVKILALLNHFREEFFEVARFLLIGISVSTVLQMLLGNTLTSMQFSNLALSMLVMMAMAFLLSLCSSSDAVVGKNMGASLPMGAVMSFMVFGPMIDVKNVILMSGSFTKRFMVKLTLVTFAVSFFTVYAAFSLGLGALLA